MHIERVRQDERHPEHLLHQHGDQPSHIDTLIGTMRTPQLAAHTAFAHHVAHTAGKVFDAVDRLRAIDVPTDPIPDMLRRQLDGLYRARRAVTETIPAYVVDLTFHPTDACMDITALVDRVAALVRDHVAPVLDGVESVTCTATTDTVPTYMVSAHVVTHTSHWDLLAAVTAAARTGADEAGLVTSEIGVGRDGARSVPDPG